MRHPDPSLFHQVIALLASWLLIIAVVPLNPGGTVRAFMPSNSAAGAAGAGGSSTHESITFDVI